MGNTVDIVADRDSKVIVLWPPSWAKDELTLGADS
jgi:hypothetical protein